MDTPKGFAEMLRNFLSFLPYFFLLFLLGALKGIIFCPIVCLIMTVGNSAVILGLWPAHVFWTYYCVIKAKSIGPTLKFICCTCLPLPLILWPVVAIPGSILAGLCYGLFTPLVATFEAVGVEHGNKLVDCFLDGTWSTIEGSCTVVRDFTDMCFHSYFSVMDELYEQQPKNGEPLDIKLLQLPGCVLVGLLGVVVDVPMMSLIALFKAPYMLYKGWKRLLHDLIGREGPFLETVCVPFAGLAIFLWPLVVVVALVSAILSSLFLGLYAGVVVYQESSFYLGLAYVVSSIALFDEYTNDVLYFREGSCFPRLKYRRNAATLSGRFSRRYSLNKDIMDEKDGSITPGNERRGPQRTKSLKKSIQELNTVQIWDQLFESYKSTGMALVDDDVVKVSDIEEWNRTGKCSILTTGLPAYCILKNLLHSVKYNSAGFLLSDGIELTSLNRPEDRVLEWFFEPLLIIKEQIMAENLQESEELYLEKLVLLSGMSDRMKAWQNGGVSPDDDIRRAELEALSRRLQGIAKLISRLPTFRRRFQDVVRTLNVEAQSRASSSIHSSISTQEGSISNSDWKPGNHIGRL